MASLAAVASVGGALGATGAGAVHAHRVLVSPFYTPIGPPTSTPTEAPMTIAPQGGYRGIESFCAVAPLSGAIHYNGASGGLVGVLTVNVGGLPPQDEVLVNWSNNYIRAPVIADFQTNSRGNSIPASANLYRLGEVRGVEVVLSGASGLSPVLGRLEPC